MVRECSVDKTINPGRAHSNSPKSPCLASDFPRPARLAKGAVSLRAAAGSPPHQERIPLAPAKAAENLRREESREFLKSDLCHGRYLGYGSPNKNEVLFGRNGAKDGEPHGCGPSTIFSLQGNRNGTKPPADFSRARNNRHNRFRKTQDGPGSSSAWRDPADASGCGTQRKNLAAGLPG